MMKAKEGVGSKWKKITFQDESNEVALCMTMNSVTDLTWIDYTQEYTFGRKIRRILKNVLEILSLMYQS